MKEDKGAEAVVSNKLLFELDLVFKCRNPKLYREPELDAELRRQRTRSEVKLLSKIKEQCILCPVVYYVDDYSYYMSELKGQMLSRMSSIPDNLISESANILVKIHTIDIVHGDYTPANLIKTSKGLAVIDFGLGYCSIRIEDRAVDLFTMYQALGKKSELFFKEYLRHGGDKKVVDQAKEIQSRARYMDGQ